ncbi:MAG: hypothetical protein ACFFKA_17950 [Candidatus Thorarchaeota archaeon]
MSESNDITENAVTKKIKDLDEKMDKFSSILEKFGLDIITKMGQTNLKITQLIDKINDLHEATLEIKSLSPKFSSLIENQNDLEKEIDLLKSLITNLKFLSQKNESLENATERNETATTVKDSIISQLSTLKEKVNPNEIISILETVKKEIFEFTGGHRICNEISQIINRLNTIKALTDLYDKNNPKIGTMEDFLNERITFWINKLMLKD